MWSLRSPWKMVAIRAILLWPWKENARTKQKHQTNGNRAIWWVYWIDANVRSFWLVKRTLGWKNFMSEELSRNQSILRFHIILQHDWPIEQFPLHIRVFLGGKTKSPCFDLLSHWFIKITTTSTKLWRTAVLVKTRVWVGWSVSRAHKTWSRWFLIFPFVFFLNEEEKRRLYLNRVNPLKLPQPEPLDLSILFSLVELGFCVRASVYWETDVHNRARCTKRTDIRPKFKAVS